MKTSFFAIFMILFVSSTNADTLSPYQIELKDIEFEQLLDKINVKAHYSDVIGSTRPPLKGKFPKNNIINVMLVLTVRGRN